MRRGTGGKSTNLQLLRKPEAKALLGADVAVCPFVCLRRLLWPVMYVWVICQRIP